VLTTTKSRINWYEGRLIWADHGWLEEITGIRGTADSRESLVFERRLIELTTTDSGKLLVVEGRLTKLTTAGSRNSLLSTGSLRRLQVFSRWLYCTFKLLLLRNSLQHHCKTRYSARCSSRCFHTEPFVMRGTLESSTTLLIISVGAREMLVREGTILCQTAKWLGGQVILASFSCWWFCWCYWLLLVGCCDQCWMFKLSLFLSYTPHCITSYKLDCVLQGLVLASLFLTISPEDIVLISLLKTRQQIFCCLSRRLRRAWLVPVRYGCFTSAASFHVRHFIFSTGHITTSYNHL